ncbi:MAG: hypothetical protein ACQEUZ_12740 [Pseudomonadota bacterium]
MTRAILSVALALLLALPPAALRAAPTPGGPTVTLCSGAVVPAPGEAPPPAHDCAACCLAVLDLPPEAARAPARAAPAARLRRPAPARRRPGLRPRAARARSPPLLPS